MKRAFLLLISTCVYINSAFGQDLPNTSITLFDFDNGSSPSLTNPKFLTGFNMKGYNNQPSFFDSDILYITSDWKAKGVTDILKLNIKGETILKVTDTEESEYSPTLTPDGQNFSTITVPHSDLGNAPQYLWKYPLDRSGSGKALSYDLANVGYHLWLNDSEVALFLVGEPHNFVIYNIYSKKSTDIDKNIGRCFRLNSKNELVYVYKAAENIWYLKTYNLITERRNIIGETLTGSEDFEILSDGSIIMAQGSLVYQLSDIGGWKDIGNLKNYGINNITRIAIKNNKIALVHSP